MSIFQKSSSLSPLSKIASQKIESTALRGASNLVRNLSGGGLGSGSIAQLVSYKAESLLNGAATEFFQNTLSRTPVGDLIGSRFASALDPKKYSAMVTPEGKVAVSTDGEGVLQYPPDQGEYYICFNFMDYKRPNPLETATVQSKMIVYLPIPAQLVDSTAVNLQIDAQETKGQAFNQGEAGAADGSLDAPDFLKLGADYLTRKLGRTVNNLTEGLAGQYAGAIFNPNLSVLFEGPTLRSFAFSWRFHPHSEDESNTLRDIIKQFKKSMLPNLAVQNQTNILGYPKMVGVTLHPDDYLHTMKRCLIQAVNVDYAPNGPSFFKGTKAPTMIDMMITLQEIEYILAEDYGGESGGGFIDTKIIDPLGTG